MDLRSVPTSKQRPLKKSLYEFGIFQIGISLVVLLAVVESHWHVNWNKDWIFGFVKKRPSRPIYLHLPIGGGRPRYPRLNVRPQHGAHKGISHTKPGTSYNSNAWAVSYNSPPKSHNSHLTSYNSQDTGYNSHSVSQNSHVTSHNTYHDIDCDCDKPYPPSASFYIGSSHQVSSGSHPEETLYTPEDAIFTSHQDTHDGLIYHQPETIGDGRGDQYHSESDPRYIYQRSRTDEQGEVPFHVFGTDIPYNPSNGFSRHRGGDYTLRWR